MVFLNGAFIEKNQAFISVMDRGFLFGDAVYEVIPVYSGAIFHLADHLQRLQKNLSALSIPNPYTAEKWQTILEKLSQFSSAKQQSLYLQITRGADTQRKHSFTTLSPNVYIESNPLIVKTKAALKKGFSAISAVDIRWNRCNIKTTSLLANVLYAQQAKQQGVEEVILHQHNKITEGASSNVFMLKNNTLFTHPISGHILPGITRNLVIKSAKVCNLSVKEVAFSLKDLSTADALWISSSTREIMPITWVDDIKINKGKIGPTWGCIYDHYQQFKNV